MTLNDYVTIGLNIAAFLITSGFAFLGNKFNTLQKESDTSRAELTALRLDIANNFVRRNDMKADLDKLESRIDRLEDDLGSKLDTIIDHLLKSQR